MSRDDDTAITKSNADVTGQTFAYDYIIENTIKGSSSMKRLWFDNATANSLERQRKKSQKQQVGLGTTVGYFNTVPRGLRLAIVESGCRESLTASNTPPNPVLKGLSQWTRVSISSSGVSSSFSHDDTDSRSIVKSLKMRQEDEQTRDPSTIVKKCLNVQQMTNQQTEDYHVTNQLLYTMRELRNIADATRIIDDVDNEKWLMMFIEELQVHLDDIMRSGHAFHDEKKKETLLKVSIDLLRYLNERSRDIPRQSVSEATGADEAEWRPNLKCLLGRQSCDQYPINEFQRKLSYLARTLDRYMDKLATQIPTHLRDKIKTGKVALNPDTDTPLLSEEKCSAKLPTNLDASQNKPANFRESEIPSVSSNRSQSSLAPVRESALRSLGKEFGFIDVSNLREKARVENSLNATCDAVDGNSYIGNDVCEAVEQGQRKFSAEFQKSLTSISQENVMPVCKQKAKDSHHGRENSLFPIQKAFTSLTLPRMRNKRSDVWHNRSHSKEDARVACTSMTLASKVSQASNAPPGSGSAIDIERKRAVRFLSVLKHKPQSSHRPEESFTSCTLRKVLEESGHSVSSIRAQSCKVSKKEGSCDGVCLQTEWDGLACDNTFIRNPTGKQHTASSQCDIISHEYVTRSEEQMTRLKSSAELMRRGLTEAREERDDKARRITVLETRIGRLRKILEEGRKEEGSSAEELRKMKRLQLQDERDHERRILEMQDQIKKMQENVSLKERRVLDLEAWVEKLKSEKKEAEIRSLRYEKETLNAEEKLRETTILLMREKRHNRDLERENAKLEREKMQEREKRKREWEMKEEEKKKNEEICRQLVEQSSLAAAATECFQQQVDFLNREVALERESSRAQRDQYDREIDRLLSSRPANSYAPSPETPALIDVKHVPTLCQMIAAVTSPSESCQEEGKKSQQIVPNQKETRDIACQIDDMSFTRMRAQDFYVKEALRNAQRLAEQGRHLEQDVTEQGIKLRKLECDVIKMNCH